MTIPRLALVISSGILIAACLATPLSSFATTCVERGDCPINGNPLEWMIQPYVYLVGDLIYPIVWGGIVLGPLYIMTRNPMLVGVIGVVIFSAFLGTSTLAGSSASQFFFWGLVIMASAIGMTAFYVIWVKSRSP